MRGHRTGRERSGRASGKDLEICPGLLISVVPLLTRCVPTQQGRRQGTGWGGRGVREGRGAGGTQRPLIGQGRCQRWYKGRKNVPE